MKGKFTLNQSKLDAGMRKRPQQKRDDEKVGGEATNWTPQKTDDWDPDLPYGGKIYLARKKKPDSWTVIIGEITLVIAALGLAYYSYYYFDHFHYHVTKGYAKLGFPEAQHALGNKYYHGHGVEENKHKAMEYYKLASDQGHAHASYNLAVGHLKGIRKDLLKKGEPHHLIKHAASNGVREATEVFNLVCIHGRCED